MLDYGVPSAQIETISEGNTFILHFAFCILHLPEGQINRNAKKDRPEGRSFGLAMNYTPE